MKCGMRDNSIRVASNDAQVIGTIESVKVLHDAGFETIDLGFGSVGNDDYILAGDDWERKVDELGNEAAKYGMDFCQLHLPAYKNGCEAKDPAFKKPGYKERFDLAMERSLLAGEKLGVPWAVAHSLSPWELTGGDPDIAYQLNREYFDKYVEFGIKHGVGFAFENLNQGVPGKGKIRYCGHYQDLLDLVDGYNDPMVGICWDFGHANIVGYDQCIALRKIGKRLKCVHIDDNFGVTDNHLLPFAGMVDWHKIFPVLAEIGYEGECNFEVAGHFRRIPRELQAQEMKYAAEVCRYLIRLYEDAAAKLK